MTSMRIVKFLRPPTPLVNLRPKFFHPLDLGRTISNELPDSPNDNQSIRRKHNPRMTIICYQFLPSGRLSFSVSTYQFCLTFFWLLLIELKPLYLLFCGLFIRLYEQLSKNIMKCLLFIIIHNFSSCFTISVSFQQLENVKKLWRAIVLCMWTNEIQTKTKPSNITFKLTTRSIVWFSPQTMQWYH